MIENKDNEWKLDEETVKRMEVINGDRNLLGAFCIGLFLLNLYLIGPVIATGWMVFRTNEWYELRRKHKLAIDVVLVSSADLELRRIVQRFASSPIDLWIGILFWPIVVTAIFVFERYLG
jgi:hypothetical protein